MSDSEGLVEVCINGSYFPVSLDNGRFSVREATVICKQLRLGNGMSCFIYEEVHAHDFMYRTNPGGRGEKKIN